MLPLRRADTGVPLAERTEEPIDQSNLLARRDGVKRCDLCVYGWTETSMNATSRRGNRTRVDRDGGTAGEHFGRIRDRKGLEPNRNQSKPAGESVYSQVARREGVVVR